MTFGQTLKALRRERDMTQEQLAELLHLSPQAISRWENDVVMPDISVFPLLTNIFHVTADYLLGIDITKNDEKIQAYLADAETALYNGKFEQYTQILREAYAQFPTSHIVMVKLADAIVNEYSRKGTKTYDEVYTLCNRILAESTDNDIRQEATQTLGIAYSYADKKDEMRHLAEQMTPSHFSREDFMLYRWIGDGDLQSMLGYTHYLIIQLLSIMLRLAGYRHDDGTLIYGTEDRIRLYQQVIDFLTLLFPDGDYLYAAQEGEIACNFLYNIYTSRGEPESAWHYLSLGAGFAIHADTYAPDAVHTSPILRGYEDGGWIIESNGNRSAAMLHWLQNDPDNAPLRADPRYTALIERLEMVAKIP